MSWRYESRQRRVNRAETITMAPSGTSYGWRSYHEGFNARLCSGCARFNCRVRELGSTGENAEGAKQAAPTAEGCSAQTATADRCASSKETADPRFHRGGEAGRHRGAIPAVAEVAA